ncbi:hypothetical protein EJB05_43138, partial [Eragrostis curvula]
MQFDRASISADEVRKALEVGKMLYSQNKSGPKGFSLAILFGEENAMESGNLSSTLQKLYMWEKKLLQELKVLGALTSEENIRAFFVLKYDDARKFLYNTAVIYIKKLATKISVAIQAIKSISNKINKLRDEEL